MIILGLLGLLKTTVPQQSEVVDAYLNNELIKKHIAGPFRRKSFIGCMANQFGVIPKSTPGKWRLIVDLSFPEKLASMMAFLRCQLAWSIPLWRTPQGCCGRQVKGH